MSLLALVRRMACRLGLVSEDASEEVAPGEEGEVAEDDASPSEYSSDDDLPPLEEVPDVDDFLAGARAHGTCAVCFEEGMMLELDCQHTMCTECLDAQLAQRWPGLRMSFGYLNCGVCRAPLGHESFWDKLQSHQELRDEVLKVATQQYVAEGEYPKLCKTLGRDPTIDELDAQVEAEMAVYACSDCRQPYCAGRVQCLEALEHEANSKHLQCRTCEWYAQPALRACCNDPSHRDCQIFKCNSCCDLAVWHCSGNRYCDRCHDAAFEHKDHPCPGPDKCPLGRPHPPNAPAPLGSYVTPFVVGCTACLELSLGCSSASDAAHAGHAADYDHVFDEYRDLWGRDEHYDDDYDAREDSDDGGFSDDGNSEGSTGDYVTEVVFSDTWEAAKQRREATRASSSCRAAVRRAHLAVKRLRAVRACKGRAGERGRQFRGGRHKVSLVPRLVDGGSSDVEST